MTDDIKCITDSRLRAMEIIKQKMVEMKGQNEKLGKLILNLSDSVRD